MARRTTAKKKHKNGSTFSFHHAPGVFFLACRVAISLHAYDRTSAHANLIDSFARAATAADAGWVNGPVLQNASANFHSLPAGCVTAHEHEPGGLIKLITIIATIFTVRLDGAAGRGRRKEKLTPPRGGCAVSVTHSQRLKVAERRLID